MIDRTHELPVKELTGLKIADVEDFTLGNGVKVTALSQGLQPVNRISVVWPVGGIDVATPPHFDLLKAMLPEGTASMSGAEIADRLESQGAWLGVEATSHATQVVLHSLNRTSEEVLPILRSVIEEPVFPEDIFMKLRERQAAALEVAAKKVSNRAMRLCAKIYGGENHPMAVDYRAEDVRRIFPGELASLHMQALLGVKPHIYIAGLLTGGVLEKIIRTFEGLSFPEEDAVKKRVVAPQFNPQGERRHYEVADALQSAIRIQLPTIDRHHPDYEALRMASVALGGYFGSRLMSNIREEKGYTYGINSVLSTVEEGASLVITCQADNRFVEGVIEETRSEIKRLATEPMGPEEFTNVRRNMQSSLASLLDSPFSTMNYYQMSDTMGFDRKFFYHQLSEFNRLTPEGIRAVVAKHLLPAPWLVAVAGATTVA